MARQARQSAATAALPSWAQSMLAGLPPLLSKLEAAHHSKLSIRTIERRISEGSLGFTKNGRRTLVPAEALVTMLVKGSVSA